MFQELDPAWVFVSDLGDLWSMNQWDVQWDISHILDLDSFFKLNLLR